MWSKLSSSQNKQKKISIKNGHTSSAFESISPESSQVNTSTASYLVMHGGSFNGLLTTIPAKPVPFSILVPASMATHFLFWMATTIAFRYLMPLIQCLFLPKSTESYAKLDNFLVANHHEQFEALSPICWIVHIAGQTMLSLTALHILLPLSNPSPVRALGAITALNAAGGSLLVGSHGLINRHPTMEKLLDFVGTRIVRAAAAATGPAILFPQFALPSTVIILILAALGKITFSNNLGRMLAILGIVAQLLTTGLTLPYKLVVLSTFFIIPFLPMSQYDKGHTIVAGTITIPYLVLLFSH